MADIKHVGRLKSTGRKCLVVFRTLPNDAFNCLVVLTESLPSTYHDALINLVETNAAQDAFEFAEVLNRTVFPDGTLMLPSLHVQGLLSKFPTDQIEMTPNSSAVISLAELNQLIAEIQGCSVQDLAVKNTEAKADGIEVTEVAEVREVPIPTVTEEAEAAPVAEPILSDAQLAAKYRSEADALSKKAAELRRLAADLVPPVEKKSAAPKKAAPKKAAPKVPASRESSAS